MSLTVTATITQGVPVNGQVTVTFTDTTSGVSGLVSRVLVISDDNGNVLATIPMGAVLVATYQISADMFLAFQETIVDDSGTSIGNFSFTTNAFYISAFTQAVVALPTQCSDKFGVIANLSNAQNNMFAALDAGLFGQGVVSQQLITYANFLVVTPYYS